ncbi:MAG TPA: hypothetical protein VMW11_05325 [Candidatus Dormibacteraeota bacterium]|nr:hypothetical protein [Candidatus Dormibacteraeota bacterium]
MRAPAVLRRRGLLLAIALAVVVMVTSGWLAMTSAGTTIHQLPFRQEFCFAEWCVTPTSYAPGTGAMQVGVHVRSDAKAATQRPDHPQAWLVGQAGSRAGGPQADLDRQVGPGASFDATLVFPVPTPHACPRLVMSEGAWPAFLGLGYAPSPFTERVEWPLCDP